MTRQLWLADKLRAYGLTVIEVPGWQDRGRPGPFDPIGVLVHHTAAPDRTKDAPSLNECVEGRAGLPGPLCQVLVARSGKAYVISAGRCNHAGEGGPLANIIGKDMGNTQLVGIEAENDGVGETWPDAQVEAMVQATAAVLDGLGRSWAHCWAHREYTPRKIDPRGIDMDAFRRRVTTARPTGDTVPAPPASTNPYAAETREALQLLTQHAGYTGALDPPWFGPKALQALHRLKIEWEQRAATITKLRADLAVVRADTDATHAEADRFRTELADALAKREAAEAEAAQLRQQLQQGGRLPQLLADLDGASADLDRAANAIAEAITKARA